MNTAPRPPRAFRIEPSGSAQPKAGRPPRSVARVEFAEAGDNDLPEAVTPPAPLPPARGYRWGVLLLTSAGALISLWAGLAVSQLIEDLFARSVVFGWLAAMAAAAAALAALAIVLREIWGLARLGRIESLQNDAARALNLDDEQAAGRALSALRRLYAGRHDCALALRTLAEHEGDIIDPAARMRHAAGILLKPLDAEAHRVVARASRRVTLLTTVTPAAALDVLFVAAQNLRMLRELATLYGGRPSLLATLRLARMVIGHLAVAGGLALSDSLLQHVVGKGLVGRLSARFGEGAVNGILTARIGLAALDVCRPVPQEASAKEALGGLLRELVSFNGDAKSAATE